jgi:hypothetical protein
MQPYSLHNDKWYMLWREGAPLSLGAMYASSKVAEGGLK